MKRVIALILMGLFLISFISASGITASAIDNNSKGNNSEDQDNESGDNQINISTQNQGNDSELQIRNRLTEEQIQNIIRSRNRIRTFYANQSECPNKCTCEGSSTKCQLEDGTREMIITADQSGNIVVQVKGVNASTEVSLYKSEDKIYGIFKDNETKEIKLLPDEIKEKLKEEIQESLENQTMNLDEEGIYQIRARKRARLFAIFPVRATIQAEVDSETGEIIRIRRPWWNFLAQDETEESA